MAKAITGAAYRRRDAQHGCGPTWRAILALFVLLGLPLPADSQTRPPATGITADYENEPDLAGLLAATRNIRMVEIEPGLVVGDAEYAPYGLRIHVFDFAQDRFGLRAAEQKADVGSRAPEFLEGQADVFAVNGGFFERAGNGKLSPSGLLVIGGRTAGREHDRAGSGVIFSGPNGVGIAYRKQFGNNTRATDAVQVGPILVDPGGSKGIYKNVGGRFNRSAICLRGNSFTAFVVEGGMSLFQFADILSLPGADGGFGCDTAINLDGGPSTQAVLRAASARRDISGETAIHNALVVSRKPAR